METQLDNTAIVCSLDQVGLSDRRQSWHTLSERALLDIAMTGNGLRLSFRPDHDVEVELGRLVALERDCCSFADWSVQSEGDRLVLAVRGDSDEAVAAVQAMAAGLRSTPAAANQ